MKHPADHIPEVVQQLHNLRVFLYVADAGSITRAAELMFKAPSAITRSIIELERAIGIELFERKPRGMLLNTYGEAVLVRAKRVEAEIEQATEHFLRGRSSVHLPSPTAISILLFNGRKLQLVAYLAALRSMSAAAGQMGMTQAGASMALSRMEGVLGQPLFYRRIDGMVASDAAERLVLHARRIFAELRYLVSDIRAIAGNIAGSVVVGTTPLGRTPIFTTAIATVASRYPALRIISVESSYEQLVRGLRSGEVDLVLGVLRPPNLSTGLTSERLFTDRMAVLVRSDHYLARRTKLNISELLGERWILPRSVSLGRPLMEASFSELGLNPPPAAVESGDLAIIRQLLAISDMLAVTSPYQLMIELRAGTIKELPVRLPGATREIGLIVREGAMLSPAATAVRDAIRCQVQEGSEHPDERTADAAPQ